MSQLPGPERQYGIVNDMHAQSEPDGDVPIAVSERLENVHRTFKKWFGPAYDLSIADAVLAAAAVERMDGDPIWLMLVGGSGDAKTETLQTLHRKGDSQAELHGDISSVGALLSGTKKIECANDATGGLLTKMGERGLLLIKDFTTILSSHPAKRKELLAAFREIYDGHYQRDVGADGGRTLQWNGRIVVIGACTSAWDTHHSVVASMGSRFVLIRTNSRQGRIEAARQALNNTGHESQMRKELRTAVQGLVRSIDSKDPFSLSEEEIGQLTEVANLVALARSPVDFDYKGDVINIHQPEQPTRLARQLQQIVRGGLAIGMTRVNALRLACRCGHDSIPPLNAEILRVVLQTGRPLLQKEICAIVGKPKSTCIRYIKTLHAQELLRVEDVGNQMNYQLGSTVNRMALKLVIEAGASM